MDRPLLSSRRYQNDAKKFIAILFLFLLMTGIILAVVLPLTLHQNTSCPPPIINTTTSTSAPTTAPVEECPSFSVSNYSFNFSPCSNCASCITFLNNSLYFVSSTNTQNFIYPFSIINNTAVYGPNQINSQILGSSVYGCGRHNDTNIYISTNTYRLALVSTIETNVRNLNGNPLYARGFVFQNGNVYKVTAFDNPSLYSNNIKIADLRLADNPCIPVYGFGLGFYNDTFYIIYARANDGYRRIGILSLNGTVYPTCSTIVRSFNSMTFDNEGQLWLHTGNNIDVPDPRKVFKFSSPPAISKSVTQCGSFGTLKGFEMTGLCCSYGFPLKMSGDGSTIIGGTTTTFPGVVMHRFIQNDWFTLGEFQFAAVTAVDISYDGNIIAIGDQTNQVTRVYKYASCSWQQMGSNINGPGGFAVSLSPDGLTLASSTPLSFNGQTFIYDWNELYNRWDLRSAPINGTISGDYSGWSISLFGRNRIAIGAIEFLGTGIGKTKIYEWNGAFWAQMGQDIVGENVDDNSGNSVSLQNNTIAIGAWENDGNGTQSGETKVYEWNGTHWNQKGQDIQGEFANDYSATTVSLSGDGNTVAIGAIYNPIITENGHVRIYDYISGVWVQRGFDIDGTAGSRAGYCSLSNDGKTVAVGAPRTLAGRVRVYCV